MIRMAVPCGSEYAPVSPAATSATTGSVTGVSADAEATSSTRTAYPSIAELSKDGSGWLAATSSARTRPWASDRPSSVGASGRMVARMLGQVRLDRGQGPGAPRP